MRGIFVAAAILVGASLVGSPAEADFLAKQQCAGCGGALLASRDRERTTCPACERSSIGGGYGGSGGYGARSGSGWGGGGAAYGGAARSSSHIPRGGSGFPQIGFDDLKDDSELSTQYADRGIRFGRSPGGKRGGDELEIDDDEWRSYPHSLEVEDHDDVSQVFVYLDAPATYASAWLLGDDDDFERFGIAVYDAFSNLLGTNFIWANEDKWRFVDIGSETPFTTIHFFSIEDDEDEGRVGGLPLGDEDFYLDDLALQAVPAPSGLALVLAALPLGLYFWRRKRVSPWRPFS